MKKYKLKNKPWGLNNFKIRLADKENEDGFYEGNLIPNTYGEHVPPEFSDFVPFRNTKEMSFGNYSNKTIYYDKGKAHLRLKDALRIETKDVEQISLACFVRCPILDIVKEKL